MVRNCHPQPRQSFPLLRLVLWTFHNLYLIVGAAQLSSSLSSIMLAAPIRILPPVTFVSFGA